MEETICDKWFVLEGGHSYSYTFEELLYSLVTRYLKSYLPISCGEKDKCGNMIGYHLDHDNHKVLINRFIATCHERRRKKKEDEIISWICCDVTTYGFNELAIYPDVLEDHKDVLEEVYHVHDVLGVQDKWIQYDSHEVVKFVCSIGIQTDDCLNSYDSFEGMVPYRKPLILDVQMYQTP